MSHNNSYHTFDYRKLLSAIPEGVVVFDKNGKIEYVSPYALIIYGYSLEDEILGQVIFKLIAPENRDIASLNFSNLLQNLPVTQRVYSLIRKDGSFFKGEISANHILDENGNITGIITVTRDVCERREMENIVGESEEK